MVESGMCWWLTSMPNVSKDLQILYLCIYLPMHVCVYVAIRRVQFWAGALHHQDLVLHAQHATT